MILTPTQSRVLRRAAGREGGFVCPTFGLAGAQQELVLRALERRGLIKYPTKHEPPLFGGIPIISGCGRIFAMSLPCP